MRWAAVLGLVALACVAGPSTPACASEDEGEDVAEPLPWHIDADTVFLRRVVDAATGRPVAGASVRLYAEDPLPIPGFGSPLATVASGADGWVRVRTADLDAALLGRYGKPVWAYAEAPGLGPNGEYGITAEDDDWELGPSTTRHVRIQDRIGRPVVDARVGWFLGCGHMPDLRSARTGPDGVAHLVGVSTQGAAEMWVDAPGFASSYVTAGWFPWERPRIHTLEWSGVVEGTILHHDGTPASHVPIGGHGFHRGPWTVTDANGHFRFVGSDHAFPGNSVYGELGAAEGDGAAERPSPRQVKIPVPPPGHRAIVRLPAPGAEAGPPSTTRLVVEPDLAWPTAKNRPSIRVIAVRTDDGWTETTEVGEQGVALLPVAAGEYVVYAEARHVGSDLVCSRARATVVVKADTGAWVPLPMPLPAFLPLVVGPGPHDGLMVEVLAEGEAADVRLEDAGEEVEVYVPTDRPLWIRARRGDRSSVLPVDVTRRVPDERMPPVVVPTFPAVGVCATFVDEAGAPVTGWLIEGDGSDPGARSSGAASPTPRVSVPSGEKIALVAWPDDPARFQPTMLEVVSSPFGGPAIDLGRVRIPARAPSVRIEDVQGKALEAEVLVTRGERAEKRGTQEGRVEDPWMAPGLLGPGAWVRTRTRGDTGALPFTRRLEGVGPWTIRAPRGSLVIEARDESGGALSDCTVHLDGRRYPTSGAIVHLTRLDAGPHEAIVEAKGRTPRRLRFTLEDGEHRTWTARLRPAKPDGR